MGYSSRVPDPEDRRVDRIREAGRHGMGVALTDWFPEGLHHLAALFRRLVDDFVAQAEDPVEAGPPA